MIELFSKTLISQQWSSLRKADAHNLGSQWYGQAICVAVGDKEK